jgi:hypothetical protein
MILNHELINICMEDNISFCLTFRAYLLYIPLARGNSKNVKDLLF